MRTIRNNVFETNSSSTHSLTICTESEYERWKNGELLFDTYDEQLITPNEIEKDDDEDRYVTYDAYCDDILEEYESYTSYYTTSNGDKIVVFGYYGYDG